GESGSEGVKRPTKSGSHAFRLHCDWRFDRRMWLVPDEFKIFEFEVVDVFDGRIQFQPRQWPALAGELFACLVKMVVIEMQIAKGMDEIARAKIDDVGHHHRKQRVRRDIEWDTKKQISAALI